MTASPPRPAAGDDGPGMGAAGDAGGEALRVRIADGSGASRAQLAGLWAAVEGRIGTAAPGDDGAPRPPAPAFFQSWTWIGAWLESLPPALAPKVLVLEDGRGPAALAILFSARTRRRRAIVSRGLYLNEVGDPTYDHLTIEYNGILSDDRRIGAAAAAALAWLVDHDRSWDEMYLSGLDPRHRAAWAGAANALGLAVRVVSIKPSAHVDLEAIRRTGKPYLDSLSRNTRYQVRRSLRLYEEAGALAYHPAETVEEALRFFDGLKVLHQAYWTRRGRPGSFANPYFERFHRGLIREAFAAGAIEVAHVTAAGETVGYLYNMLRGGWVHGYQSGFAYDDDPKRKPGLVSHTLAIEHHLRQGARVYDFMAGDSQHKSSLGSHGSELAWLVLQRDRLKYRIENGLRRLKERYGRTRTQAIAEGDDRDD